MINQQLIELYESKVVGVQSLLASDEDLDGPHLMHCWEDEYMDSRYKILFVGKECNGWMGYVSDIVRDCTSHYERFRLSKSHNRTVFWQYVYWINAELNPATPEGNNFLWSNVSKFCTEDGKGLEWAVHIKCVEAFNCLEEEIRIIKPDVIFFLSGPWYDDKIKIQFSRELSFCKAFDDIPHRKLARIEGVGLPLHTYRTYHPSYLQRKKLDFYIERIFELIHTSNI